MAQVGTCLHPPDPALHPAARKQRPGPVTRVVAGPGPRELAELGPTRAQVVASLG